MGMRKPAISDKDFNGPKKLPKGSASNFHFKAKRKKRKSK